MDGWDRQTAAPGVRRPGADLTAPPRLHVKCMRVAAALRECAGTSVHVPQRA